MRAPPIYSTVPLRPCPVAALSVSHGDRRTRGRSTPRDRHTRDEGDQPRRLPRNLRQVGSAVRRSRVLSLRMGAGLSVRHLEDMSMWILFSRSPTPDAPYWRGRRSLAALDALAWPALWLAALLAAPFDTGSVEVVAAAALGVSAARRVQCALWRNRRYRFTTWRWGVWLALAVAIGALAKLMHG